MTEFDEVHAPPLLQSRPTVHNLVFPPSVAAVGAAALVLLGIRLMHRTAGFTFVPSLPSFILAEVFPNPQWVVLGTLCALLGCAIAFIAVPAYGQVGAGTTTFSRSSPSIWARTRGIFAAVAGAGLYVYVLEQALGHQPGWSVLPVLIAVTVLFALAIGGLLPGACLAGRRAFPALSRWDWAIVAAVILAFLALTLHDARNWLYSYIGDEWAFYDAARGIAQGNPVDLLGQAGVYGIHPLANSAYQAAIMRLFGIGVAGWRMSSALSVALPVVALFWLGKQIGGTVLATVASILYATCHLLWAFAHIGYNNNDPLLFMIPAAALLYGGLRAERHSLLFASGACAGAAWYSLFTGRLMIGIVGLVLLTEWQGGWRAVLRRLAFVLAGFTIVVVPLVLDNGLDTIRQMFPLISLSQARTQGSVSNLLAQNSVRGVYAFMYATEYSHYVVGEVFDIVSASALCLGFALTVRRLRDLASRLLLIWFAVGLMLTTPLYYVPQIADTRLQAAIPPASLLAALGLCSVACAMQDEFGRRMRAPLFYGSLAAALIAAVALNGYRFYVTMPRDLQLTQPAMTIGALEADPHSTAILAGTVSDNNLCQVLDGFGIDPSTVLHFLGTQLVQQCPGSSTMPPVSPPSVLVIVSSQNMPDLATCRIQPQQLLEAPNKQQVLWGYRFIVAANPGSTYVAHIARINQEVLQICPALVTLPPQ